MDTPVDLVFGKTYERCFITHSFLHLFTFSNRCSMLEPHRLLLSLILNPDSLSVPQCELSSAKMLIWPNREVLYQRSQFAELHHGRAKDGSILPF